MRLARTYKFIPISVGKGTTFGEIKQELLNMTSIFLKRIKIKVQMTKYTELNLLGANPTKWSNTLKQFIGKFLKNCLSVFDHFVRLTLKSLSKNL